jgi:hypothetical protein
MKTDETPERSGSPQDIEGDRRGKRPYRKPAFRHERVFETQALTCGKIGTTQYACKHSPKLS